MKFFTFCLDTKSNKKVKAAYKKATFLRRHAGPLFSIRPGAF